MTSGKNQVIFAQGNKYFDEQALFKWIIENNDTEKADNKPFVFDKNTSGCIFRLYNSE